MKRIITFSLFALLIACSSDDDCLRSVSGDTSEFPRRTNFVEIYADANYKINATKFMTPNGDGINDFISLYIEDLTNNSFYVTDNPGINGDVDPNTTEDPSAFFNAIEFTVSNQCETLHTSNDVNFYVWTINFDEVTSQGNYDL